MRNRRPTFAFLIALSLALASPILAANPYLNRQLGLSIGRADIPCAAAQANNMEFIVNDCASAASCATGGTATAFILCDSGTTVYLAGSVAVSSSYVPVTAAAQQTLTATGAGNDITLTAADKIVADAGGDINIESATAVNVSGGGAPLLVFGEDSGAASVTSVGGVVFGSSASTLALSASTDLTATAATVSFAPDTSFAVDVAGGTDELGIAEDSVSVSAGIAFRIVGGTAPPVACAAGVKGTLYFDTDINKMCVCNGTNYVLMNDDSTTTGCS